MSPNDEPGATGFSPEEGGGIIAAAGFAQSDVHTTSAKHDVGSGAGDIGKGAAKGAGSAAKGTGKAAGHLVTLHPVKAAGDVGKGAANTGKNVLIGTPSAVMRSASTEVTSCTSVGPTKPL